MWCLSQSATPTFQVCGSRNIKTDPVTWLQVGRTWIKNILMESNIYIVKKTTTKVDKKLSGQNNYNMTFACCFKSPLNLFSPGWNKAIFSRQNKSNNHGFIHIKGDIYTDKTLARDYCFHIGSILRFCCSVINISPRTK